MSNDTQVVESKDNKSQEKITMDITIDMQESEESEQKIEEIVEKCSQTICLAQEELIAAIKKRKKKKTSKIDSK